MTNPLKEMTLRKMPLPFSAQFGAVRRDEKGIKPHQGWDLKAPIKTPAYAVAHGFIDKVNHEKDGLGTYVILKLDKNSIPDSYAGSDKFGDDLYAVYGHLSKSSVTEGDEVDEGEKIGETGRTGNAEHETPHLHFELRATPHPGTDLPGRIDPADFFADQVVTVDDKGLCYPLMRAAPTDPLNQVNTKRVRPESKSK